MIFMQHHVFAVWDFMCLIKALQRYIVPATALWTPPNPKYARLINQLVLDEESDETFIEQYSEQYCSHFESYCYAMREVGANTILVESFLGEIKASGINQALNLSDLPASVKEFVKFTMSAIDTQEAHIIASVLAYGREWVIPGIFPRLLNLPCVDSIQTPILHGYLARHIDMDEHEHSPLMDEIVQMLCAGDPIKVEEVRRAAEQALNARLGLWNGICEVLN